MPAFFSVEIRSSLDDKKESTLFQGDGVTFLLSGNVGSAPIGAQSAFHWSEKKTNLKLNNLINDITGALDYIFLIIPKS